MIDLQFVYNSGKLKLPPRLDQNMPENECKHSDMDFFLFFCFFCIGKEEREGGG